MYPRFHVVRVAAFIGMYRRQDQLAWSVADSEQANAVVSGKYWDREEAERVCKQLNEGEIVW